ncbi:MAG: sulfotransferase domain-containing protein [Planctomycetota bacterium]
MMHRGPHKMRLISNELTRQICKRFAGRLSIYPMLEYPKCGGTWLSRMLADTLQIPFAQFSTLPVAMPAVVHGHWKYHKGYRNVTFLIRDGRDVMVSFYFHYVRLYERATSPKFRNTLDRLYGPNAELQNVHANLPRFIEQMAKNPVGVHAGWARYNDDWWDRPGVVYTRYETLREDCVNEMTRIAEAHGIVSEPWRVERAVDGHSMERAAGRKPGEEDRSSFIRKGVVGDWKNHFSDEAFQVFADLCGDTLVRLGYEQSSDWRTWKTESCGANATPEAAVGEGAPG